jgi:hypothetical protein
MMWGFGLALMLGCAVVADAAPWRLSARRIGAFVLAVIGAWAVSKLALSPQPLALGRFDLAAVPILLAVLLASRRLRTPQDPRRLVVIALLVTAAATFGRFNPVQSAKVIFAPKSGPVLETFRAYAAAHPRGWVAAPGMYGAVLNGAGVGAINHTLLRPQPEVFGLAYPDLDAKTFNRVFNRYAHVAPRVQWAPSVVQADLVALPPDPFSISLPIEVAAPATGLAKAGALETVETVRLGQGRWGVTASGWAPWSGVAAGQGLRVALVDPDLVQIVGASAYRLPRPDIVLARNDPQAFAAGFGLRLEIESKSPPDGRAALVVVGVDPGRGGWLIGPGGPR